MLGTSVKLGKPFWIPFPSIYGGLGWPGDCLLPDSASLCLLIREALLTPGTLCSPACTGLSLQWPAVSCLRVLITTSIFLESLTPRSSEPHGSVAVSYQVTRFTGGNANDPIGWSTEERILYIEICCWKYINRQNICHQTSNTLFFSAGDGTQGLNNAWAISQINKGLCLTCVYLSFSTHYTPAFLPSYITQIKQLKKQTLLLFI